MDTLLVTAMVSAIYTLYAMRGHKQKPLGICKEHVELWLRLGIVQRELMADGSWGLRLTVSKEEAHRLLREDQFLTEANELIAQYKIDFPDQKIIED